MLYYKLLNVNVNEHLSLASFQLHDGLELAKIPTLNRTKRFTDYLSKILHWDLNESKRSLFIAISASTSSPPIIMPNQHTGNTQANFANSQLQSEITETSKSTCFSCLISLFNINKQKVADSLFASKKKVADLLLASTKVVDL